MRIPKVSPVDVAYYIRVIPDSACYDELDNAERNLIEECVAVAEDYCSAQTGLEKESVKGTDNEPNADLRYAVKAVAAEMYDTRQFSAQYETQNPTVRQILNQHAVNLLPEVSSDEE